MAKVYQQILRKLAKKGLVKPSDMTPANFAQIVAQQYPTISKEFVEFTNVFEYLMYQKLSVAKQREYLVLLEYQYVTLKKIFI